MKVEYKILTVILIISTLLCIISFQNTQATLNIVGSSSVQPVCEQLVEEYKKTRSSLDINIQGGGSSLGIKCANSSIADIGMSSKEIECDNLTEYEIGKEAIIIIVNRNNPINDLSTKELQKIFTGEIKNWSELSNQSGKINVIIREEGSGTLDSFKDIIMNNKPIRKDAIVQNSAGSIKQAVIQDKNAIGFVSLTHLDNDIKNLSIDKIPVSKNTVLDGSYKLQRPFLLLVDDNPEKHTQDFIQWVMGSESEKILEDEKIFRSD